MKRSDVFAWTWAWASIALAVLAFVPIVNAHAHDRHHPYHHYFCENHPHHPGCRT